MCSTVPRIQWIPGKHINTKVANQSRQAPTTAISPILFNVYSVTSKSVMNRLKTVAQAPKCLKKLSVLPSVMSLHLAVMCQSSQYRTMNPCVSWCPRVGTYSLFSTCKFFFVFQEKHMATAGNKPCLTYAVSTSLPSSEMKSGSQPGPTFKAPGQLMKIGMKQSNMFNGS